MIEMGKKRKRPLGIIPSAETRQKMSVAKMGNKFHLGMKASPETRAKMSASLMGNTHTLGLKQSPETVAKRVMANWKGGRRATVMRYQAKRRLLGFIPLNKPFFGSEGHHVDTEQVIYMPQALHRSIPHRQSDPNSMAKIKAVAYNFLFKQEIEAAIGRPT
jgi:hypothetical protein